MGLLSNLSDDQIALLGCAMALISTGTLMCVSYFIGRSRLQPVRVSVPAARSGYTDEAAKQRHAA
jgi:hypothetical protein